MTRIHCAVKLMALALVLGISTQASAWPCSTGLDLIGKMPAQLADVEYRSVSLNQSGFLANANFSQFPPTLRMRISGSQKISFEFSENIKNIRVFMGKNTLYQGQPIKVYDGTKLKSGELGVELNWTGDNVKMKANYECGLL